MTRTLSFETVGSAELDALLAKLPALVVAEGGPTDRAITAACKVIAKRARSLAPSSKSSGSKRSDWAKYGKNNKWTKALKTQIKYAVRKFPTGRAGYVGAVHPEGNAANFMQEKPRKHVMWKNSRTATFRIARNWITKAFDETKSEQQTAMATSLQADIDKVMRGG